MIAACGVNENDPAKVAQALFEAVLKGEGEKISRYICRANQDEYRMIGMVGGVFGNMSLDSGFGISIGMSLDLDLRDVNYRTVSRSSSSAQVQVNGEMRISMLGIYETMPLNDQMYMIYEDGRWKYCPS